MNVRDWFNQIWPRRYKAVLSDYAVIGTHPHFLADVALRGFVFSAAPRPADLFQAGMNEGRRQLALEIVTLAGQDPKILMQLIEKPER